MQNENTTATAPMTADSLKAAYDALPDQLRPFYAYLHSATTALLNAIYSGDAAQAIRAMAADGQHSRELSDSIMLAESFAAQLAEDAAEFDRASLTDEGLQTLVQGFVDHCNAEPGQSPLTVALDALFGGLMSNDDFTNHPSPDEAVASVLANHPAKAYITLAFNDLNVLLDRLFDYDPSANDFPGSFIELPDEAADVRSMTQAAQRLSAQTRGFFAWIHGAVFTLADGFAAGDAEELQRRLLGVGLEPLFVRAILDQMASSVTARDVFAADEEAFAPFSYSLANLEMHLTRLRETFAQSPEMHPLDRTMRLLVAALAGVTGCRPEDLDSTLDAPLKKLSDQEAASFGLAVTFAAEMAGVELVKTMNSASTLWDNFSKACNRVAQCRLCGTLSFALRPAMTFLAHKDLLLPALEQAQMKPDEFEEILGSLDQLSDFLLSFQPNWADQEMVNKLVNEAGGTQEEALAKAVSFQELLLDTLSHMDPHNRELLSNYILHLAFLLGGMHSLPPETTASLYREAYPDLPNAPVCGFLSCEVLFAAQALAESQAGFQSAKA
ncbi:MAG: hypothetical protein KHX35_05375 [Sutterella wadsworthensis]|nr:hypothetical protein [Sutterella wadsworthensis]